MCDRNTALQPHLSRPSVTTPCNINRCKLRTWHINMHSYADLYIISALSGNTNSRNKRYRCYKYRMQFVNFLCVAVKVRPCALSVHTKSCPTKTQILADFNYKKIPQSLQELKGNYNNTQYMKLTGMFVS